jgi:WD40 repeat protein
VRFLPDGRRAVSGSGHIAALARDNTVRLWDLETGVEMRCYEGHSDRVWDLALSPCGRYVLSAGHDGAVRLWDLNASTKESAGTILLDLQPQAVRSVAFGPDGHTVLVGPARGSSSAPDFSLHLLDLDTGRELRRFAGYGEVVTALAISPDGRLALSGALDGAIHLWDMESGKLVRCLEGHSRSVLRVLFNGEGDKAVSGSLDDSVIVWDVAAGVAIRRFFGHHGAVTDLCLACGGRTVVSVSADRTMREWRVDVTQDELLAWIRENRCVPELTPEQRVLYQIDLLDVDRA